MPQPTANRQKSWIAFFPPHVCFSGTALIHLQKYGGRLLEAISLVVLEVGFKPMQTEWWETKWLEDSGQINLSEDVFFIEAKCFKMCPAAKGQSTLVNVKNIHSVLVNMSWGIEFIYQIWILWSVRPSHEFDFSGKAKVDIDRHMNVQTDGKLDSCITPCLSKSDEKKKKKKKTLENSATCLNLVLNRFCLFYNPHKFLETCDISVVLIIYLASMRPLTPVCSRLSLASSNDNISPLPEIRKQTVQ